MPATRFSQVTSGLATLGGLWAVATPFVLPTPEYGQMLNVPFGVVLLIASGYYTYMVASGREAYRGAAGLGVVCGFALLMVPFLADAGQAFTMSNLVVGLGAGLVYGYEILSGAGHTTPLAGLSSP